MAKLILSIFPGIDLLGRGFEEECPDWCIVRGPDLLWGGDVHNFRPPAGVFWGVIGGPPCKCFSSINHLNRAMGREPRHPNLIPEFERVVDEARPVWFLMENVPQAPEPQVVGYWPVRALTLNNRWLGESQNRERRFSFGVRQDCAPHGIALDVSADITIFEHPVFEYAVTGHGGGIAGLKRDRGGISRPRKTVERGIAAAKRPIAQLLELQGLPSDLLDYAPFTSDGKRDVIGNGVPIPMGRAVAKAIRKVMEEK